MKAIVIILAIVALALVVCFILAVVLVSLNEEPGPRCGTCVFFDRDLRICWSDQRLPNKEEYTKPCKSFEKGELR